MNIPTRTHHSQMGLLNDLIKHYNLKLIVLCRLQVFQAVCGEKQLTLPALCITLHLIPLLILVLHHFRHGTVTNQELNHFTYLAVMLPSISLLTNAVNLVLMPNVANSLAMLKSNLDGAFGILQRKLLLKREMFSSLTLQSSTAA